MPTPHGSRGGMAFSADELRILRRALAHVLNPPSNFQPPVAGSHLRPASAPGRCAGTDEVQDALRLAEAIDEAVLEGGRMRAFALAELVRYRAALPGAAGAYLRLLEESLADGYLPDPDDLAALRSLSALPCTSAEHARRMRLRGRCTEIAGGALPRTPAPLALPAPPAPPAPPASAEPRAEIPRITSVVSGGRVTDFTRAPRSARRELHGHNQRRGGTTVMSDDRHDDDHTIRPIPTPADLWPRGVRPSPSGPVAPVPNARPDEPELATG